jgi:hypothetical protein
MKKNVIYSSSEQILIQKWLKEAVVHSTKELKCFMSQEGFEAWMPTQQ